MSFPGLFRSQGRSDRIGESERRMAEVTNEFTRVVAELPPALRQAEALVSRLQDIRQEIETVRLMKVVAGVQAQEEAQA